MSPFNLLILGFCVVFIFLVLSIFMFVYAVFWGEEGEKTQVIVEAIKTFLFSVLSLLMLLGVYYL